MLLSQKPWHPRHLWWHTTTGLEADTWCTCEGSAHNRLWSSCYASSNVQMLGQMFDKTRHKEAVNEQCVAPPAAMLLFHSVCCTQLNSHHWFLTEVLDWFADRPLNYFTDHKHTINGSTGGARQTCCPCTVRVQKSNTVVGPRPHTPQHGRTPVRTSSAVHSDRQWSQSRSSS